MIYQPLDTLARYLDNYLINKFSIAGEHAAILSTITDQDGTVPEHCLNKIALTLVSLEQDKNIRGPIRPDSTASPVTGFNNLYVLVSAVFEPENYDEGLKSLNEALLFFLDRPVFNSANTPDLDTKISQIRITPVEQSMEGNQRLWTMLDAKYRPSVLFRVQVVYND